MNDANTISLEMSVAAFLESLRVRGYAPATLAVRRQGISLLAAFLAGRGLGDDVREITRSHIRGFATWLQRSGYRDHTRSIHLGSARALFAHLDRTGAIVLNPCADLAVPRIGRRLPRTVLTPAQARAILDKPPPGTRAGLRDRAILELLYSTGLRLSELARLSVFDVDDRGGFVRVNRGKGARDRVVPLGRKACGCVRSYLTRVRSGWAQGQCMECALWLSSRRPHGPLKSQMIAALVKRHGNAAGFRVTPHIWRHTCATHLVANGANLAAVQRQLGHASLRTTQLYTRVAVPDLVAMHAKAHPRARTMKTR